MNKKYLLAALVIALIGVGVWQYQSHQSQGVTVSEVIKEQNLEVKGFSGLVALIEGQKLVIKTGFVETTSVGNKYIEQDRTVFVTDETEVVWQDLKGELKYSDLQLGQKVRIETRANPYEENEVTATRILLSR